MKQLIFSHPTSPEITSHGGMGFEKSPANQLLFNLTLILRVMKASKPQSNQGSSKRNSKREEFETADTGPPTSYPLCDRQLENL